MLQNSSFVVVAVAVLILLVIVTAAIVTLSRNRTSRDGAPYQLTKALFTPAERSFLGVLDQVVGPDYRVFGKVRMADIANVKSGLSRSAQQSAFNRVSAKHFDFIVCRSSDLSIVCAVELNDSSHRSARRQSRDGFVVTLCQGLALPLLQVPAKQSYSIADLQAQFRSAISSQPATAPTQQIPRSGTTA